MLKNKYLYIILAVLVFLYLFSFSSIITSKDKREIVETSLVNKKYENQIFQILLQNGKTSDAVLLEKKDELWLVNDIPANSTFVNSFIKDLVSIRNLYKHSKNLSEENAFGLNDGTQFSIRYWITDSDFYDLYFGKTDFAGNFRYLMNGKNPAVYEIETGFDKYLSASVQSWSDPFIISKSVIGNIKESDVDTLITDYSGKEKIIKAGEEEFTVSASKLLELRNGGPFYSENQSKNLLLSIKVLLGNKDYVTIQIYSENESSDEEFLVKTFYCDYSENKNYSFNEKISYWTYNKIKEIML